jgi:hypothetical protein
MERTYEEYSVNCKNCGNLSHFPGETYLSSSDGTRYPRYHCIERGYIFNNRNVPLQKPCGAFTPTLWCLIKHAIKKLFNRVK